MTICERLRLGIASAQSRIANNPSGENSFRTKPSAKSSCTALNPRERKKPVKYAVDGYGVLSCVIGGMSDRTRIELVDIDIWDV